MQSPRHILLALGALLCLVSLTHGQEIICQKGVSYAVQFPIVDSNNANVSDVNDPDSEYSYSDDGATWSAFADCTNEVAENATTGWYTLTLTAAELDHLRIAIWVKVDETDPNGAIDQRLILRTTIAAPQNVATTTSGRAIDVEAGGTVGVDLSNVNGTLDETEIGDAALTSAKLGANCITSAKLAPGSITATQAPNLDRAISSAKLAADGLDEIAITPPTGAATTFREQLVLLYRRFFAKTVMTATTLNCYADDGTTVITSQSLVDTGTSQTLGAAQ